MDMAVSAGDKMNQLINSLLEFSRSGVLNEELQTIKVEDAIDELKFSLNPLIEEHHAEIVVKDNIKDTSSLSNPIWQTNSKPYTKCHKISL